MAAKPPHANELILLELENLAANLGDWSGTLVLGGGVALIVYDRCMAKTSARPVGTTDMDFLIPRRPVVAADAEPLSKILKKQGFLHRPKDVGTPPIESYVKEIGETEIEVEFLTDARTRSKSESALIAPAQVVAQSLSYLEMSLASVTTAILPGGTKIQVVRPEAWVFHKGLTFTRRKSGSAKGAKDLYGIWFVLTMLGYFSDATWVGLKSLQSNHPSAWKNTFRSNLKSWIAKATPRDWSQLSAQDTEQRLTEAGFRRLIEKLNAV